MRLNDLSGKRFGLLRVVSRAHNKKSWTMWNCQCDCGRDIVAYSTHLLRGNTKSCGCKQSAAGAEHVQWEGYGEISGQRWAEIQRRSLSLRSSRLNHTFSITIEYAWELFLLQNRKCALTGQTLTFSKTNADRSATASLDRIDSSKGYEPGNVQWVHKDVNRMKNVFPQDYFIATCQLVARKMG